MALHPGTCIGLSSWWWGAPPKTRLVISPGKMMMMSLYCEDVLIEEFKVLVVAQWARKFKKSRPKKFVKSNKLIS